MEAALSAAVAQRPGVSVIQKQPREVSDSRDRFSADRCWLGSDSL